MIIVIDTETTGDNPANEAEVIELAGVSLSGGRWSGLVKPTKPIPPDMSAIHHLIDSDFSEAYPNLFEAWSRMVQFLWSNDDPIEEIAAHNAAFDWEFCKPAFPPGKFSKPWLCTWRLALHLFPDSPRFNNQTLRYYLGLKPDIPEGLAPHRALYDAIVTAEILKKMLEIKSLDELLTLQDQPVLLKTCRFGKKHWGQAWSEVPKSYLGWMLDNITDLDKDTKYTAQYWRDK